MVTFLFWRFSRHLLPSIFQSMIRTAATRLAAHPLYRAAPRALSTTKDPRAGQLWAIEDDDELRGIQESALLHRYTQLQVQTAEALVPWFLSTMPSPYFRQGECPSNHAWPYFVMPLVTSWPIHLPRHRF